MMPKRVVDGEAIAGSKKLRAVRQEYRIHYPYLLTVALANGVFEYDPESIWGNRYSVFMPAVTRDDVGKILAAFEHAGLLFKWYDEETKKEWGYWTNSDKPGRLPTASRMKDRHEKIGPYPPEKELSEYMKIDNGNHLSPNGDPIGSQGFGFGFGFGLGLGSGVPTASVQNPPATMDLEIEKQERDIHLEMDVLKWMNKTWRENSGTRKTPWPKISYPDGFARKEAQVGAEEYRLAWLDHVENDPDPSPFRFNKSFDRPSGPKTPEQVELDKWA
jgi:hypothetical protein